VIQSKVAVGSGGLTGKGYLRGSQTQLRFIPEQWTDFIFCVPAEEFGFLGALGVLLLYALIIWRGLKIAFEHESRFSSLICIGIVAVFAIHVFINVGMTLGLTPVIGLPLPFLSYGGSSVITSAVMIGLLLHAYAYKGGFE
jgi:rod shape determining protein RodA